MKILFVDDDATSVQPALDKLATERNICTVVGFTDLEATLPLFEPDIVVLDMMDGGPSEDVGGESGKQSYETIWDKRFCPIIIYSAIPGLSSFKHPLVATIQKGSGSEIKIFEQAEKFAKEAVQGISNIKKEIDGILQSTLRDVVPPTYLNTDVVDKNQTVLHMARRRVAAYLDEGCGGCGVLMPWEQFIIPPFGKSLLFGDIIRKKAGNIDAPDSYALVLTPSCDMDSGAGRKPLKQILYAECCAVDKLFSHAQVKKDPEILIKMVLTQGFHREYYCVPGFKGLIPPMLANLKKLAFIETEKIAPEGEFLRVASIDSPFREQLAWAHLNTACRPGVPDRDFDKWAGQYIPDKK